MKYRWPLATLCLLVSCAPASSESDTEEMGASGRGRIDIVAVVRDLEETASLETVVGEPESLVLLADDDNWVSRLQVPPWVTNSEMSFTRRYRSLTSPGEAPPAGPSPVSSAVPSPLLVIRTQGRDVLLSDITPGSGSLAAGEIRTLGTLRVVGDCRLMITPGLPRAGSRILPGRLSRSGGDWLFHLATQSTYCEATQSRGYPKTAPDRSQRERLIRVLPSDSVTDTPVRFTERDIRDFVISPPAEDRTRYVWAVLRQVEGTQMAPAPAIHQQAVLAQISADGVWTPLWSLHLHHARDRLGLAGVHADAGSRVAEGWFVERTGTAATLLRVGLDAEGQWGLLERRALGPLPA